MKRTTELPAWAALERHHQSMCSVHMRELFVRDAQRFESFSGEACGLFLDYSKHRITRETLVLLFELADAVGLRGGIERLFTGELVNSTEGRAALHMALRYQGTDPFPSRSWDVMPDVRAVLTRMGEFCNSIRNGEWKGYSGKRISTIVNIGIGGSDLGPAMAALALRPYWHPALEARFVSNLDSAALVGALREADPETTLFVVASKTFATLETLTNARSARRWLVEHYATEAAVARHFVAISTQSERVTEFGIDPENMFGFWDWVGGRYSLWSAIGLPVAVLVGMERFEELLQGAARMDEHFRGTEYARNLPVILALLGVWYRNFFGAETHAVLAYDYALQYFPSYLQQLEMESNGKHVTRSGAEVDSATCPIIWGGLGNNGQHAFYQLLHQGTSLVSSDFLVPMHSQFPLAKHEEALIANALAQSEALMRGRNEDEAQQVLRSGGVSSADLEAQLPHRLVRGNQPSTTIVYERLTPRVLGALIALYEHKVFVQSMCWDVNPFDQWGVELGKALAEVIMPELESGHISEHDSSTAGLIAHIHQNRIRQSD